MIEASTTYYDQPQASLSGNWAERLWSKPILMWMVGFWIVLYVIRPWEKLFPELGPWHVERVYCLSVLAYAALSGSFRIDLSRQTMAAFGLLFALILSSFVGIDPSQGSVQIYKLIVHLALYFMVISIVRKPTDLYFLAIIYLVAVGLYLGKSEWEYFVHNAHGYSMGVRRLTGIDLTYRHPNGVGASAVLTLPFWYFLWQNRITLCAPHIPHARWLKYGLLAYPLVAFSAVLLTNSRGAMLGCVGFALLAGVGGSISMKMIGRLLAVTLVVGSFFYLVMPQTQRDRLTTVWDPESGPESAQYSAEGRIAGAKAGWQMFRQFPLTGVGTGNWKKVRPGIDGSNQVAHNLYGQILGEFGLLGGCAFTFFVAAIFANFRRVRSLGNQLPTEELDTLAQFALAGRNSLILLLFFGLGSSNLTRFNWYWLAALGVATWSVSLAVAQSTEYEPDLA